MLSLYSHITLHLHRPVPLPVSHLSAISIIMAFQQCYMMGLYSMEPFGTGLLFTLHTSLEIHLNCGTYH